MANLTGAGLAKFAKSKKGTPYIYGCKGANGKVTQAKVNSLARTYPSVFTSSYLYKIKRKHLVGKVCCDCSGLISWYTKKLLGSAQLYSQAKARLPISQWKKFAVGTVMWKQGHVGVYLGDGLVAEAKGIDYGTIISKVQDTKWQYGLTFSWMEYDIKEKVDSKDITSKGQNPYTEPTKSLKKGSSGEGVKWLQWELNQSGYKLAIDGKFGSTTKDNLVRYQKSAKITADGICGATTRKKLKADK
jgi:cell wall-associated NlpC family hydrolase